MPSGSGRRTDKREKIITTGTVFENQE